jgi:hypothetical protein
MKRAPVYEGYIGVAKRLLHIAAMYSVPPVQLICMRIRFFLRKVYQPSQYLALLSIVLKILSPQLSV